LMEKFSNEVTETIDAIRERIKLLEARNKDLEDSLTAVMRARRAENQYWECLLTTGGKG
jgi:hypothetical protein